MINKVVFCILFLFATAVSAKTFTSIATYGEPLYSNFSSFPYVNPNAPKGGKIVLGGYGTFDNLNPYILKGQTPDGLGMTMDSLMAGSSDELMSAYPLIAESVELPEDLSYAIFNLNPQAKYDDGTPITAEDFEYSFNQIQKYGAPFLQNIYADVESVEVISKSKIRYNFKTKNNMKTVMIAASSSPLPKAFWQKQDFEKMTLDIAPSSGAYKIKSLDAGRSITYERVQNYWAKDLNVNVGRYNFDEIKYDFYSDEEVMFEAFKAGKIDFRFENKASRWVNGYDIPALKNGELIKSEIADNTPKGLQGIFLNTRKDKLADIRVRKALEKLFNFEYLHKNLLNGMYVRAKNYFNNSDWGYDYQGNEDFAPTINSVNGITRENKRIALNLFAEAGYELKDSKLVNSQTGEQFSVEFLIVSTSMERVLLPYIRDLQKMGINASLRRVDTSQYVVRMQDFDFDATVVNFNFFVPPGVELLSYYGSESADINGSANYMGVRDKEVDKLISEILSEKNLNSLKEKARLLDRKLLQGYYGITQWYNNKYFISFWNKFEIPEISPKYGYGFPDTWFIKNNAEISSKNSIEDNSNLRFKIMGFLFLMLIAILMNFDIKRKKAKIVKK